VYGEEMLTKFVDIYSAKSGWEEKLKQEDVRFVLVEADSKLADALKQSSYWKISYADSMSVVFTIR